MIQKVVYSRDGVWAYTMCGTSWVNYATHLPTMTTHVAGMPIARVRALAASGWLIASIVPHEQICQGCKQINPLYQRFYFCEPCLNVAPNANWEI